MPRALVTGITGQDGSYLAEHLLAKGYEVHGTVRSTSRPERSHIRALYQDPAIYGERLFLHTVELVDSEALTKVLLTSRPDEVYHLAGQTNVRLSFEDPEGTVQVTAIPTLRLLECARGMQPMPRLFHASSSEIYGSPMQVPQDESTPMAPVTPYGCAKAFATQLVKVYRQSFGLFACNGILFNHESPRRGQDFVTRKICRGAAAVSLGLQKELVLGNLDGERDWGHARDYVEGMWLALQQPAPEDFVFATGELHSVREVVEHAFRAVQLDWRTHVRQDAGLLRPTEPSRLLGNAAKAKRVLGWEPRTGFTQLIAEMTQAEITALANPSTSPRLS